MPFKESNVSEVIEQKRQTDPEFRKAWDESRAEYELIGGNDQLMETRKNYTITIRCIDGEEITDNFVYG